MPRTKAQAAEDLFAYIDTLTPAEALGEMLHVADIHNRVFWTSFALGVKADKIRDLHLEALIHLARRLASESGIAPAEPHDDVVHSCELVGRILLASAEGRSC